MMLSGGLVEAFCRTLRAVREAIQGGSASRITAHAGRLQNLATDFTKVLDQLRSGRAEVAKVWIQGKGRDATLTKFDQLITHYAEIIKQLRSVVPQLQDAARQLQTGQEAFVRNTQLGSDRIAQILATGNPGAKAAAAASAAATTSGLQSIMSGLGKALEALGFKGISPLFDAVGQIAGQVQQMQSQSAGLASALPSAAQYQPPMQPTDNTWTPVDQQPATAAADPAVKVTLTGADGTRVVEAHQDTTVNVDLGNGQRARVEIDVDEAAGK
jgi:uncharacterized protein YukE